MLDLNRPLKNFSGARLTEERVMVDALLPILRDIPKAATIVFDEPLLRRYAIIAIETLIKGRIALKRHSQKREAIGLDSQIDKLPASTYWWLRMIDAQSRGEMPVWGGIRIVREERKTAE